jgi:hypothetical protein
VRYGDYLIQQFAVDEMELFVIVYGLCVMALRYRRHSDTDVIQPNAIRPLLMLLLLLHSCSTIVQMDRHQSLRFTLLLRHSPQQRVRM